MMRYSAVMNTPGYLPWSDEAPVFDTPGDAWRYLAGERREAEDSVEYDDTDLLCYEYSETVQELEALASANAGAGSVYGDTPGYDGDHDLGIAYSVQEVTE